MHYHLSDRFVSNCNTYQFFITFKLNVPIIFFCCRSLILRYLILKYMISYEYPIISSSNIIIEGSKKKINLCLYTQNSTIFFYLDVEILWIFSVGVTHGTVIMVFVTHVDLILLVISARWFEIGYLSSYLLFKFAHVHRIICCIN